MITRVYELRLTVSGGVADLDDALERAEKLANVLEFSTAQEALSLGLGAEINLRLIKEELE